MGGVKNRVHISVTEDRVEVERIHEINRLTRVDT